MLYFVNPGGRARRKGRKVKKRRTAAQKRATAKMIAARKRKLRGKYRSNPRKRSASKSTHKKRSTTMAAKRKGGKKRTASKKRRSPISHLRRGAVYVTNPRKRRRTHRRRRYFGNPGIMANTVQTLKDTAGVVGGAFIGQQANTLLPSLGSPYADAAKGIFVAVGVKMLAGRFLGRDMARFVGAGAMIAPIKTLITAVSPKAGAMLGSYDQPILSSYADVAGYMDAGEEQEVEVSSYSDAYSG